MKVRIEKTDNFYDTAKLWWSRHSISYQGKTIPFPPVNRLFLPVNVFIVSENGEDLYSCFFYHTDSHLCWLAYPISNLKASVKKRQGGLEFLFKEMEKYAHKQGYVLMFTTTPVKNEQKALLNIDYVEGDISVSQYFKQIS